MIQAEPNPERYGALKVGLSLTNVIAMSSTKWQENLVDRSAEIRKLVLVSRRVAVLGIKTELQADQPAFYVPKYLSDAGLEVIPVPVYYPEVTEILGKKFIAVCSISQGRST